MDIRHDFAAALAFSQGVRDRWLRPFYASIAEDGRYVFVDKSHCSLRIQKELAVDTIIQAPAWGSLCIEEKLEQRYTGNFALETHSVTLPGQERPGWMVYGQADWLLYGFLTPDGEGLDIWLMNFAQLKDWFWQHVTRYREVTLATRIQTRIRLVPIEDVGRAIGYKQWHLTDTAMTLVATCRRTA